MTDITSNEEILKRHRDRFRTVHPDVSEAVKREAEAQHVALKNCQIALQQAVGHLHAVLSTTAKVSPQQRKPFAAAQQWLDSFKD